MQARFRFPAKMAPSSSGPGLRVLSPAIAGSNPAGVTTKIAHRKVGFFRGYPSRFKNEVRSLVTAPCEAGGWINVRYPAGVTKHKQFTDRGHYGLFLL